jgi:hypothetical protein
VCVCRQTDGVTRSSGPSNKLAQDINHGEDPVVIVAVSRARARTHTHTHTNGVSGHGHNKVLGGSVALLGDALSTDKDLASAQGPQRNEACNMPHGLHHV